MERTIVTIRIVLFPYMQPANGTAHRLVQKYQRQSALQRSGRTDQLTEIGCSLPHYVCEKQGKQDYKHQKNHIFQLSKKLVPLEGTDFLWKRNLIQQVLDQSKGAEKPHTSLPRIAPTKIRNPIT